MGWLSTLTLYVKSPHVPVPLRLWQDPSHPAGMIRRQCRRTRRPATQAADAHVSISASAYPTRWTGSRAMCRQRPTQPHPDQWPWCRPNVRCRIQILMEAEVHQRMRGSRNGTAECATATAGARRRRRSVQGARGQNSTAAEVADRLDEARLRIFSTYIGLGTPIQIAVFRAGQENRYFSM